MVPVWPSRPFWGRLRSGAWPRRVAHTLLLGPGSIVANAENAESCFFQGTFNSRLLVLRTRRLGSSGGAAVSTAGGASEAGGAEGPAAGAPRAAGAAAATAENQGDVPAAKRVRTGKARRSFSRGASASGQHDASAQPPLDEEARGAPPQRGGSGTEPARPTGEGARRVRSLPKLPEVSGHGARSRQAGAPWSGAEPVHSGPVWGGGAPPEGPRRPRAMG